VLSGGGARASYQVGVLAAIAEKVPDLNFPITTGVSAGAINAFHLASHQGPFRSAVVGLKRQWCRLTSGQVYDVRVARFVKASLWWLIQGLIGRRVGPTEIQGLLELSPLRRFLQGGMDFEGIAANINSGKLRAAALSTTSYSTGETVTFVQCAECVPTWVRAQRRAVRTKLTMDHIIASASIPIVFPAVELDSGYYGDGSVRQTAPLAPAIHLGARRILAIGMRADWGSLEHPPGVTEYPSAAQVMGLLFHSVFMDALETDAERLVRLNELLARFPPGTDYPARLKPIKLLHLRPSLDLGALARPHWSLLPGVIRAVVRAVGGQSEGASDFISYLLFDPQYTGPLIELGYDDGREKWPEIERFLADD
jgi:NTE family protein